MIKIYSDDKFFSDDKKGKTEDRPIDIPDWYGPWFDQTLDIPIWWNGSAWIDASGKEV